MTSDMVLSVLYLCVCSYVYIYGLRMDSMASLSFMMIRSLTMLVEVVCDRINGSPLSVSREFEFAFSCAPVVALSDSLFLRLCNVK